MPGINPKVMEHLLNIDPVPKPVIQKKRHMGPERAATTTIEVQKLLEESFIREYQYPEWISNAVLVVSQLNGDYKVKDDTLSTHVRRVPEATKLLKHFSITHIPQSENR